MTEIEQTQKLSVLHCVYQLIASAEGNIHEERDYKSIKFALTELGFNSIHFWDAAIKLNPHDCFYYISTFEENNKKKFKNMLLKISEMEGNIKLRLLCANHISQLCKI